MITAKEAKAMTDEFYAPSDIVNSKVEELYSAIEKRCNEGYYSLKYNIAFDNKMMCRKVADALVKAGYSIDYSFVAAETFYSSKLERYMRKECYDFEVRWDNE